MYWILFVMALLFSLVVAIIVGGLATPRQHTAARTIVLRATPEAVWNLVRTVSEYPNWRDDIQSVELHSGNDNRAAWTEVGRQKSVSYIAIIDEPPTRFTARITDEDLGYSGEWQFVVSSLETGTRLTITEQGEVGNPVFRFIGAHIVGYTGTIDTYLRDIALELGEQAKPQTVTP